MSLGGNAPLSFIDPTVGDGFTAIRYLTRSATDASLNGANWAEPGNKLSSARWYATAQTMPDSSVFVASGSLNGLDPTVPANNNPTYEILNADGISSGTSIPLAILEKNQPYYMYPFVHLLNDGNLFIFVSKSAEIFNVAGNKTVATLPDLEGDFRTYPNTGGVRIFQSSSFLFGRFNWRPVSQVPSLLRISNTDSKLRVECTSPSFKLKQLGTRNRDLRWRSLSRYHESDRP